MVDLRNQFTHFVVMKEVTGLKANAGFINHVLAVRFWNTLSNKGAFRVWNNITREYLTEREIEETLTNI